VTAVLASPRSQRAATGTGHWHSAGPGRPATGTALAPSGRWPLRPLAPHPRPIAKPSGLNPVAPPGHRARLAESIEPHRPAEVLLHARLLRAHTDPDPRPAAPPWPRGGTGQGAASRLGRPGLLPAAAGVHVTRPVDQRPPSPST
jgi:hypothetical protein